MDRLSPCGFRAVPLRGQIVEEETGLAELLASSAAVTHRMWRFGVGLFFLLHGLAHAAVGMAAQDAPKGLALMFEPGVRIVLATALFAIAMPGFVAAGLGSWGVFGLERWRLCLTRVAAVASTLLLVLFARPLLETTLGLVMDAIALVFAVIRIPRGSRRPERPLRACSLQRPLQKALSGNALVFATYLVVVVLLRPWHRHWGATAVERTESMIGDEHAGAPARAGDRAITIHAPADDVWPWLVQIGEDRGGFYSYASLENAFRLHVVNADRVVAEWQGLASGDFVRATPPGWCGGIFGDRIGWEVDYVDPAHRLLALRYWIFEVESTDANTSRLHVRTHAGDPPVPAAALLLLTFEPAHFVMERAMLIGIKVRAERLASQTHL